LQDAASDSQNLRNEAIEPNEALLANCVHKAGRFGKLALMRETWDRRRFAGHIGNVR